MRKIREVLFKSKRRKATTVVSTVALVVATGALAYFLLQGTGSTTATGHLGTGTTQALNLTSTFGSGLIPGGSVTVTVTATNPATGFSVAVPSVTPGTISTPGDAVCASYLSLGPNQDGPVVLAGNGAGSTQEVGKYSLSMTDSGSNQGECQGQATSIPFTIP